MATIKKVTKVVRIPVRITTTTKITTKTITIKRK